MGGVQGAADASSASDASIEPGIVVVRIVREDGDSQKKWVSPLGVAIVDAGYASVYAAEIQGVAQEYGVPATDVMAYAVVHEIGHLLLGPEHSAHGIMKAHWGRAGYLKMTQEGLAFRAAEVARMRGRTNFAAAVDKCRACHSSTC